MEQNLPIIAKKVRSLVRVIFFMLRKGISKIKFFADLNMMINRGKIAGKALHNLLFNHHHNWVASTFHRQPHHLSFPTTPPGEYEFSCKDTPPYPLSLFSTHKKHQNKHHRLATPHAPPPPDANDDIIINAAVMKALEMLTSTTASPALPGFGKSPMVKQLRITDSPFPLSNGEEDGHVDEAAEKFIMRFYNNLKRQN
ncbi:uncharacterized protein LOC111900099 [Lactuca sativa]|uniref:uncharacterized protein LOC111900099 n=1 Tax=Lactuca sativa TaxID=4236 RepID=UPI000CC0E90A|nr:uncharacterized protein LOC111900099 [Lactuca sativa]